MQEYNRAAVSPRMTRAQRRKSLAVDQSLQLEPGLARAVLDEQQQDEEGSSREQQQPKKAAGSRRKSLASVRQVGGLINLEPSCSENALGSLNAASSWEISNGAVTCVC